MRQTRALVHRQRPWLEIEQSMLDRFALPGGKHFSQAESIAWANRLLHNIRPPAFRAVLPKGSPCYFMRQESGTISQSESGSGNVSKEITMPSTAQAAEPLDKQDADSYVEIGAACNQDLMLEV